MHPVLIVAFASPPVLYKEINVRVTIFASGLLSPVDEIRIINATTTNVALTISGADATHADGNFNKIFFTMPSGFDAGSYDIELVSEIGCTG